MCSCILCSRFKVFRSVNSDLWTAWRVLLRRGDQTRRTTSVNEMQQRGIIGIHAFMASPVGHQTIYNQALC
jgi:hypothetical protein